MGFGESGGPDPVHDLLEYWTSGVPTFIRGVGKDIKAAYRSLQFIARSVRGMQTYQILRKYQRDDIEDEEVETGITLEEAQTHCDDPESSSRTCTSQEGEQRTQEKGAWFDAYYPEE